MQLRKQKQVVERLKVLEERLNLLGKVTLQKDNIYYKTIKKSIFFALFVPIVFLDIGNTWLSDFIHPNSDSSYWEMYFGLESFKMFLISVLCRMSYEFYIFKPLKNPVSLWLVNSWLGFCVSDLIDVLMGQRSDFTAFDVLAIVFCLLSLCKSCRTFHSSNKQNN